MARYAEGMSKNQTRRMRLNDRLALAVQDVTARAGGVSQSSGRAAEPRAVAPQVPEIENILDSEAEMELLRRRNEDDEGLGARGKELFAQARGPCQLSEAACRGGCPFEHGEVA